MFNIFMGSKYSVDHEVYHYIKENWFTHGAADCVHYLRRSHVDEYLRTGTLYLHALAAAKERGPIPDGAGTLEPSVRL